ncbi:Uncharacterised protein [Mycobacterium tuberculosis]|nr:Uncharacterised protein [Mycobacterium tuberculosis]
MIENSFVLLNQQNIMLFCNQGATEGKTNFSPSDKDNFHNKTYFFMM